MKMLRLRLNGVIKWTTRDEKNREIFPSILLAIRQTGLGTTELPRTPISVVSFRRVEGWWVVDTKTVGGEG